ncbi:hypothetical protein [Vibrio sp. 99-70-13A1]|uniref:hypothetical protein n=1 Tax=Vibrio sp. 99-70-13A1 TaxID=2607601 RepID=UPI001493A630|nr:hypothetical protein [Vibrio sp. 99-70-13A1]NOH98431.1 hypothetical protein [Vibrio sp. 99-70-13A1]
MTPVGSSTTQIYSPQQMKAQNAAQRSAETSPIKVEQNKVTLSDEGKALLAALQEIDKEAKTNKASNESVGDKVESFAHGALGMDHPDKIEEEDDGSYSAGQYLSAAATVGGILLAIL